VHDPLLISSGTGWLAHQYHNTRQAHDASRTCNCLDYSYSIPFLTQTFVSEVQSVTRSPKSQYTISNQSTINAMSWSTLSEDLWKRIMEYVPLDERLKSCSQVNSTLHKAAAAATCVVTARDVHSLPALCQWMTLHGRHLTSLQLSFSGGTLTQLPCPNLRELDLGYMQVQLSASSTQLGVLHSCTRLTKLTLVYCRLTDGQSSLAALSLVGLQHLTIDGVDSGSFDDSCMPSTVLQHLTQLTHLSLDSVDQLLNADSLQQTSCLVNLQELNISGSTITLSPSTTPGLSRLTALRQVRLQHASLDPSILQDCTQLQGLELLGVAIISAGSAAALHSLLGCLQQLQSLKLFALECDWPAATAAYSSLTASSHLDKLELHIDNLPPGIWPHIFPPDRQLPALQQWKMWNNVDVSQLPPAAALGTDDISCLVNCCPGLHTINIDVQPNAQLSALAKASGLTSLWVSGLHSEGFESLRALSGLVSLQELTVDLGGPITPQDLLCLTALTGLTKLRVDPVMMPDFEGAGDVELGLYQVCMYVLVLCKCCLL